MNLLSFFALSLMAIVFLGCGGGSAGSGNTNTNTSACFSTKTTQTQGSDPNYHNQWYLNNTGQLGVQRYDLKVASLWNTLTGQNVRIAVADDGLQTDHEDLLHQVNSCWSYDYTINSTNVPAPDAQRRHATNVAGILAATRNNLLGGHGIAPEASLINLRVIGEYGITDSSEAKAMIDGLNQSYEPHIYNNSWGPHDRTGNPNIPNDLWDAAIVQGVTQGRNGLGTIYLWASGNGYPMDTSNFDSYANHPDVLAICAVDDDGYASYFSEDGDNLLVCGFGDSGSSQNDAIYTTDVYTDSNSLRYRSDYSGTSAAVPMVSGIIALMLEANAALTWRDVREILIRTARKTGSSNGWQNFMVNGETLNFHHRYGFGLVDASAAVTLAKNWNTPREGIGTRWTPLSTTLSQNLSAGATYEHTLPVVGSPIQFIESTLLTVSVSVPSSLVNERKYRITLISPSGRESLLLEPGRCTSSCDNLNRWRFSSRVFWGDRPNGMWRLRIEDTRTDTNDLTHGRFNHVKLEFHGR